VRRVEFVLEKSIGDPTNDIVTVPNIALLGASTVAAKLSIFAAMALGTLMSSMKAPPLLNLTVYDFLWGYDDPLVTIGSTLLPNVISFKRLGILDRVIISNFIQFFLFFKFIILLFSCLSMVRIW